MSETNPVSAPSQQTLEGEPGSARSEPDDWGLDVLGDDGGWSPGATGTVWWNAATASLEIWTAQGCTRAEVPDNTEDGVACLLGEMGWELGSGWAYAADSDTVRYAAVDPFEDEPATVAT